uniref:Uncharacterized protein n=1 Tax=Parascaris equorum TaxID=6256 RepID=A0A914R919_PAREQ
MPQRTSASDVEIFHPFFLSFKIASTTLLSLHSVLICLQNFPLFFAFFSYSEI